LNNDISRAIEKLNDLKSRLDDRAKGIIKGGKQPTVESVGKQVRVILKRPFLETIIQTSIRGNDTPTLSYSLDTKSLEEIADTILGKKIIITTRDDWDVEHIIRAYHSQFAIEHVFKHMKDRNCGVWWPMNHWTTQKIHIHGLYCTVAVLIRALIYRRIRLDNIPISYERLIKELDCIREVINVFKKKKRERRSTVLTRLNEIQNRLIEVLQIPRKPQEVDV
jgi:transposase